MHMLRKPAKKRASQKQKVEKAVSFIGTGAKMPRVFSFYTVDFIACLYLLKENNFFSILKMLNC